MSILNTPLSLTKNLTLKNRCVMAPMTRSKTPDGVPSAESVTYYQQRAAGGLGLIITEGVMVDPCGHGYPALPNLYTDEACQGWQNVVNAVHEAGSKIFPQLWHTGSVISDTYTLPAERKVYGPSAIAHPGCQLVPTALTDEDIQMLINSFVTAARHAKDIGFDGIELHGAHGYLIDQFFWAETNKRDDQYGGESIGARNQFACELIRAVKKAVGQDFCLSLRLSQWKLGAYQAKLCQNQAQLSEWLLPLADAGVDLFHMSTRRFWEPAFDDTTETLAQLTKDIVQKPVIAVGSIGLDCDFIATFAEGKTPKPDHKSIEQAIELVTTGGADLIALGRTVLHDPNFTKHLLD